MNNKPAHDRLLITFFTGNHLAYRGIEDIRLRERGTKKVHIFTGERKQVNKPASVPAWMPAKIWKPNVKKVGVEKLEELRLGAVF